MNTELNIGYSNDCLYECKELVRECVNKSSLQIDCDEIVACIHEEIDIEKFKSWLSFNLVNFKSKTNQTSYFKKSFENELKKGTFKVSAKVDYLPNTQELINEMRNKGIVILADDTDWLNVAWWHILNETKLPMSECMKLNRTILRYMKTEKFSEYQKLLMNSNTLKPLGIDWKTIEQEAIVARRHWIDIMEELESEE